MIKFVGVNAATELTGINPHTLRRFRQTGALIEGVHYVKPSTTIVLYNQPLLLHWLATRGNPGLHETAIASYLGEVDGLVA